MRFILLLFLLITISSKHLIEKTTEEDFEQKRYNFRKIFFPRSPMRSITKPFSNLLNNKVKVPNPIKIRKEINIGKNKKITIGAKNANHNTKLEGSYKKTKNLEPGIKQDTTFSGSVRARFGDGQKSISISVGKTTTNTKGITYTKKKNRTFYFS